MRVHIIPFILTNILLILCIFFHSTENNQYSASNFYSTPTGQSVYSYSAPVSQPSRESSESAKPVYLSGGRAPLATHQTGNINNQFLYYCRAYKSSYIILYFYRMMYLIEKLKRKTQTNLKNKNILQRFFGLSRFILKIYIEISKNILYKFIHKNISN